jgi:hypothetical protein
MFGKQKEDRRTAQTRAVVLSEKMTGRSDVHGRHIHKMELRAHFDDGTTADFSETVHGFMGNAGDIVTATYDPADRSNIGLSEQTWADAKATVEGIRDSAVARAEAELSSPPPLHEPGGADTN